MKGHILMSISEADRIEVIEKVIRKEIKQKQAAIQMNLSTRQVRRLVKKYKREGVTGLTHKSRGQISNNKKPDEIMNQAITTIKDKFHDFGPTLAHEKLKGLNQAPFSVERLRLEMIKEELWKPKQRKTKRVYQMRLRRACRGELVQADGSPHAWFEDRGSVCTLLILVDDATGKIMAGLFAPSETTFAYFKLAGQYLLKHGKMVAIYSDKHGVLRVNSSSNGSASTNDSTGITQFGRAMKQLKIQLIFANSPQAKGRVENRFGTLQDRLVKELRLKGISNIEEANIFLPEFLDNFNDKFGVDPRSRQDLHRDLTEYDNLDKIFTLQEERTLTKNLTCQYKNLIYQIKTKRPSYALRHAKVTVREYQDGSIKLEYQGKNLDYMVIDKKLVSKIIPSKLLNHQIDKIISRQLQNKPAKDHPWRVAIIN